MCERFFSKITLFYCLKDISLLVSFMIDAFIDFPISRKLIILATSKLAAGWLDQIFLTFNIKNIEIRC